MPYAGATSAKYAWHEVVSEWPELVVATNELEFRLRRDGRPGAADMLLRAYGQLRDELLSLARRTAVFATEELRASERATRVRPDTHGQGGPRLEDSLIADPLPHQDLLPGSIGVADKEVLDNNVPWWVTNELGNTTNVGRRIYGFFWGDDDAAPPSPLYDRQHPLFTAGVGPESGMGTIREPIPARRFVQKALPAIEREWQTGFEGAKRRFDNALTIVLGTMR